MLIFIRFTLHSLIIPFFSTFCEKNIEKSLNWRCHLAFSGMMLYFLRFSCKCARTLTSKIPKFFEKKKFSKNFHVFFFVNFAFLRLRIVSKKVVSVLKQHRYPNMYFGTGCNGAMRGTQQHHLSRQHFGGYVA